MKSALHLQMRSITPSSVTEDASGAVSSNGEPHALHDTLQMRSANAQSKHSLGIQICTLPVYALFFGHPAIFSRPF